jgi:tRNA/tmRNA/rRNA uracil-C5-methylase (TrmA/RlmC/RlmD family)
MKLIKWLLEVKAPRIVYVSCNPATCARDLDYLCHGVVCFVLLLESNRYLLMFSLSCDT